MYRKIAVFVGSFVSGVVLFAGVARADIYPQPLHQLVQCESGGNPRIVNTSNPNRPAGLYQIITSTWRGYGGGEFAPTADQATPYEQYIVAERIYASAPGSWACAGASGFAAASWDGEGSPTPRSSGGSSGGTASASTDTRTSAPEPRVPDRVENDKKSNGDYTIKKGDTLTKIAEKKETTLKWLKKNNKKVIEHMDWIFPGEKLNLPKDKKQDPVYLASPMNLSYLGSVA